MLLQETRLKGNKVQTSLFGDFYLWREDEGVGTTILLSKRCFSQAKRIPVPSLEALNATGGAVRGGDRRATDGKGANGPKTV